MATPFICALASFPSSDCARISTIKPMQTLPVASDKIFEHTGTPRPQEAATQSTGTIHIIPQNAIPLLLRPFTINRPRQHYWDNAGNSSKGSPSISIK